MAVRKFYDDGRTVSFSCLKFRQQLNAYRERCGEKKDRVKVDTLCLLIAQNANVSTEAVKNWYKGKNGVSDFAIVKSIAEVLNIDYTELLVEETVENHVVDQFDVSSTLGEEKELVKQVFGLLNDFIYLFMGDDCRALHLYANPYAEMNKYIFNLYHFVDSIALSISEDTYSNLRKTITELYYILECTRPGVNVPEEWLEVNNYLGSPEFEMIYEYENNWQDLIEDYVEDDDAADNCFHMLFEDMPELITKADVLREVNGKETTRIKVLLDEKYDALPPSGSLVVREFANTLIKIMKKRFSKVLEG